MNEETGDAVKISSSRTTFDAIELNWKELADEKDFDKFLDSLLNSVIAVRDKRLAYYRWQRRRRSFVNVARKALVVLGIVALASTAFSAAIRLATAGAGSPGKGGSTFLGEAGDILLALALVCYVLMSALSFWETATAATAAYFRQIQVIVGIRDLWTQFEFDLVKALRDNQVASPDDQATKTAILGLARTLVAAIDALSRGELDEWKQEFQTSVSSLQAIGNAGLDQVKSEIKAQVDAAVANSQKGFVALTVTGVAAPVEVTIDDTPPFASNILSFTLPPLTPGVYRLRLTGKNAAAKDVEISAYLQVPAGISSHAVAMDTGVITAK